MKTVAFIPIKLNNERLPGKNTKTFFDGTPLVHFVQKTLLKCEYIDDIYVFCSDAKIKSYLLDGVKFLQRDASLDSSETLAGDLIASFVKSIDADIYIMAHATSPFVLLDTYKQCINAVVSKKFDSAIAAKKFKNFIWFKNEPLNFLLDSVQKTQDIEPVFCEISSPYVFTRNVFANYNSRSGKKVFVCECNFIEFIDIDYPEDFEFADKVYQYFIKKDK
ncbi:hypothetical protein L8T90_01010 [Campylobacter sp. RKI_CA19_01121]|uniref:acylneuraminate cytidylyltransferase family protein n=1 Tax=Campylobacter sp. RKI_CA19_01121 TaxID=2911626 RepID=UPI0021E7AF2D|nr:hypothetical protein [Campylobacter sp. RKI_CA19_01121]MCV3336555.1 hypothetical protein [Campylobacter sp. RKI_CA19_01121]